MTEFILETIVRLNCLLMIISQGEQCCTDIRNRRTEDKVYSKCSFGIKLIPVMFINALNDGKESFLIIFSNDPLSQKKKEINSK